jgi:hypothetical protein
MQVYSVGGLSKARVWWDCDPFDGAHSKDSLAVEIWIPRGAFAEYGLLGASVRDELRGVQVLPSVGSGVWRDSLAGAAEPVMRGLPAEYRDSVLRAGMDALSQAGFGSGLLYDRAAHAAVGSNARVFGRLASSIATLLMNRERFVKEGMVQSILAQVAR